MHAVRRDNFDALRLFAALCVFFSHSFSLYSKTEPLLFATPSGVDEIDLGTFGASVFFVISGFLVTHSFVHSQSVWSFVVKRLLRIFPAVIFNFCMVTFVLGALGCLPQLSEYFREVFSTFPNLVFRQLTLQQPHLPLTFMRSPEPNVINPPFWTLKYEMGCYATVALAGLVLNIRKTLPIITAFYVSYFWREVWLSENIACTHGAEFLLSGCFYLYRERIPLTRAGGVLSAVILGTFCVTRVYFLPVYVLTLVYLVPCMALKAPYIGNVAKYGDFSYGFYLHAWPTQQVLLALIPWGTNMFPLFVAVSAVAILPIAALSCWLVEQPALAFKKRVERRAGSPASITG